ncbi:NAD(P)-dependent oxidoreductase [Herbaspirillum sp. RTI4]|uniref:NAD(P)-dependent oxidoreductase n=1 Tax=Herbaspirillum sp. RTI4 TaxID=3048640 RepID=UPI002AB5B340|nr:NAD(P)-dependent oxidoreductase [Herbaspirillum sp. RTI4]MDY7577698.1 NAD(P)-dependent oxidoreductase [Herbaspirillum sp. RTI4]MEA9980874.1 NAD(P)-dependent oxidoreductase [Herbaspirillum sp. RTI4]
MNKSICFIGLGMMGYPMAALLAKAGYALQVSDADPLKAKQFADEYQAQVLDTGTDKLTPVDIVITMLPNSEIVESVILGKNKDGLAYRLPVATTFIDMSSSEPMRSRQLSATLAAMGQAYIDAPVSGGVKKAVDGSLAIMVGGAAATYAACTEVLQCLGKTLFHVGDAGAGHAMKALNNYVSAAGLIAAVEALHVGQMFGLDPAIMTDVLNTSTGRNNTTEGKVKQFMLSGTFGSGFSLQLMTKDLGVAMKLGQELNYPMNLGNECLKIWKDAAQSLDRTADHTEMYRLLADARG